MNLNELIKIIDSLSKEEQIKIVNHIMEKDKEFYSIEDIANLFGISWRTIQRYIKNGRIKAIKVGRQWRIPLDELRKIKKQGL